MTTVDWLLGWFVFVVTTLYIDWLLNWIKSGGSPFRIQSLREDINKTIDDRNQYFGFCPEQADYKKNKRNPLYRPNTNNNDNNKDRGKKKRRRKPFRLNAGVFVLLAGMFRIVLQIPIMCLQKLKYICGYFWCFNDLM